MGGIVQNPRERDHVRGVEADESHFDRLGGMERGTNKEA